MKWFKSFLGFNNRREKTGDAHRRHQQQKQNTNSGVLQSCLGHSGRDQATETDSLCENPNTIPPNITPAEAAWLRSFYAESDKEQSKHAIAVAAATAAAADAAVAAAQAAVAVVRLTSQGRGTMYARNGGGSRERWGAIKVQTVFRGYLARKALRALKGLVKLQALVRGYLVRKQAAATFQSMQALLRAQANIRAQRTKGTGSSSHQSHFPARQSVERSVSFDSINMSVNTNAVEESPKIVEMDTGRPHARSRPSMVVSDSGDDDSSRNHDHRPPNPPLPRFSLPERCCHAGSGGGGGDSSTGTGYSTAQSTPRIFHGGKTTNHHAPSLNSPSSKSVCLESLLGNSPNYMADTKSFKAKLRSQSAPRQRHHETKRRQSIQEMMGSRNSLSCVRSSSACSHVGEALNFKNAVMSKLGGRSTEFVRDQYYCRHCHMQQ